jgi:NTE family protein
MGRKVALVLSSGGARGMAHIGVIEAIVKSGFEINSIAGSSIGSVVGGMYASQQLEKYRDWMLNLDKMDVFRLLDFTVSRNGLIKGEKVFREMEKIVQDVNIENLLMPYAAVAVDITQRKEVVFTEGSLFQAMRASVAIPSILQPGNFEGSLLVDGGVLNPLPLNRVKRVENDLLIAVDLNSNIPFNIKKIKNKLEKKQESGYLLLMEKFRDKLQAKFGTKLETQRQMGYFNLMINSFEVMQEKLTALMLEQHKPDLLVKISRESCSTFEFYRTSELIEYGRKCFTNALDESNIIV